MTPSTVEGVYKMRGNNVFIAEHWEKHEIGLGSLSALLGRRLTALWQLLSEMYRTAQTLLASLPLRQKMFRSGFYR